MPEFRRISSITPALTAQGTASEHPLTRRALHELQQALTGPRLLPGVQPQYILPSMHRDIDYPDTDTQQQPSGSGLISSRTVIHPFAPFQNVETEFNVRDFGQATVRHIVPDTMVRTYEPGPGTSAAMNRINPNRAMSTTPMDPTATASHENGDGVGDHDDDRDSQAYTVSNHSTTSTLSTIPDPDPVFPTHTEASFSPSDASDCSAEDPAVCQVCTRRKAIVRFVGCTHGLCVSCMKGTWWGRINRERHWPTIVPCGLCRAEIGRVWVRGEGRGGPCPVLTVLEFMVQRSVSVRGKLRWEEIDRVRPVEIQPWLIYNGSVRAVRRSFDVFSWNLWERDHRSRRMGYIIES
ncbi:hypothetical protein P167DRAFT_546963 [Morchella conica CCBAS932]|uniref:RING-type domain-containing protein n=1 Tax=Morchella conica CCBAS932 TaxID=1392247 RepID=A0A3N4KMV1_9PEZI|nr:hypothetical protein P167DRAFT_546963 [Morchella conica CCBAS932]